FTHQPTCASPAPPPPDTMDLLLTFLSLETQIPNSAAWCYVSVNNSPHERVPYEGLVLSPDSRNPLRFSWWQIATRGMMLLPRHPVNNPVTLNGIECIGQRRSGIFGITLAHSLGVVNASHPRVDWNGAERVANSTNSPTGESFRLRYRIGPDTPEARRQAPTEVRSGATWVPLIPLIPAPVNIRYNPNGREACDQIPPSQNLFGINAERMACELLGRPTITWEWRGTPWAIAGFVVEIDSIGATPRVGPNGRAVLVPREELARVSQSRCGEQLNFSVAPFLTSGLQPVYGQGVIQLSPCPAPTTAATVEVTFNDLEVGGSRAHGGMIQDNDTCFFCVDREMELCGELGIIAGTSRLQTTDTRYWHGGRTGSFFSVCGDEATCISQQGVYPWARFALANTFTGGGILNNNTLRVLITEGATLTVWVSLRDVHTDYIPPSLSGDPYCIDRIEFPARSVREWATIDETRTISQDHGEASCRITFRVRGRTP
ncbi:MAG: hypothetical protein N2559_16685, partial [Anaerolineae bacterium]|nr:hypothetical protein [Anaerolineae bacterium]